MLLSRRLCVLIPFLAGLLFGLNGTPTNWRMIRLNPLFGGSAFRTTLNSMLFPDEVVLIPFLAGLLFGPSITRTLYTRVVLIPFLAGLLFGLSDNIRIF